MPGTCSEALLRPQGDIDVLIGACDAGLVPFCGTRVGNLRLGNMPRGCGKVLRGSHPSLFLTTVPPLTEAALVASRATQHQPQRGQAFQGLEGEKLGTTPSCRDHAACSKCRIALDHLSPREREVAAQMDSGMTAEEGVIKVQYPWLPTVLRLQDNIAQAKIIQSSISLVAKGLHEAFT